MAKRKVIWSKQAKEELDYYCSQIALDSVSSAKKVRSKITSTSKDLGDFPSIYQLDEYYPCKDGNVRRFFCWNYRVVYEIFDDTVIILRIYHTRMRPENIK